MLRAAVLLSLLRRVQRFSTIGHPRALVACYAAACPLPRPDFHRLADDSFQDTPAGVRTPPALCETPWPRPLGPREHPSAGDGTRPVCTPPPARPTWRVNGGVLTAELSRRRMGDGALPRKPSRRRGPFPGAQRLGGRLQRVLGTPPALCETNWPKPPAPREHPLRRRRCAPRVHPSAGGAHLAGERRRPNID
jgi:hypothetical protein